MDFMVFFTTNDKNLNSEIETTEFRIRHRLPNPSTNDKNLNSEIETLSFSIVNSSAAASYE